MNRIEKCFAELKKNEKKALITFLTAGDPSLSLTEEAVLTLFEHGADIVELGVPFSDPIAESAVIQEASLRSLANHTTLDGIFDMVKKLRKRTDKPLVLMMYLNTIFVYGTEKFFSLCAEYGIDGVIVPDMPYEEREELLPYARKYNISSLNSVSPFSKDRIREIAADSTGFLYCVSPNGVPAPGTADAKKFEEFLSLVGESCTCPYCVGGELAEKETIVAAASRCDGVIIDSILVQMLAKNSTSALKELGAFVAELRTAL